MSEVRTARVGLFVGGDASGGGGGGVTSFNGRTGAVVSAVGDYLAAIQYNTTPEVADFAFQPGTVHVIDSASTDPAITGLLPPEPADKDVVGWWFNQPTGPFGDTAGLNVDPNGKTITGNPFPFFFHTRFPGGCYFLQYSAAADTWLVPSWCDFILGNAPYDDPAVMVRRSSAFGQLLFPIALQPDSLFWRPGNGDVQASGPGAPSIIANFAPKAYAIQSGLGGYDRVAFAEQLNTLLQWWPFTLAGDTVAAVNRAYRIAPPADTIVTITLPDPATLEGGEQVLIANLGTDAGGIVLDATTAGFLVNGSRVVAPTPPNTRYTMSAKAGTVLAQYTVDDISGNGYWDLISSAYDETRVQLGFARVVVPASGTADLPGPAAGYVRFYQNIQIFAEAGFVPVDPVDFEVYDTVTTNAVPLPLWGGNAFNTSISLFAPISADEVVRMTSTGPTGDSIAVGTYIDRPAAGITLVRQVFTDNDPIEILPAAPSGFFRRWCQYESQRDDWYDQATVQGVVYAAEFVGNATDTHLIDFYVGSDLSARAVYALDNLYGVMPPPPIGRMSITADGLSAAVLDAFTPGTEVWFLGAYEQIPLSYL